MLLLCVGGSGWSGVTRVMQALPVASATGEITTRRSIEQVRTLHAGKQRRSETGVDMSTMIETSITFKHICRIRQVIRGLYRQI